MAKKDTKKTSKSRRKGRRLPLTQLSEDHPIFSSGVIVGGRFSTSKQTEQPGQSSSPSSSNALRKKKKRPDPNVGPLGHQYPWLD